MTYIRHRRHAKSKGPKPDPRLEGMRDQDIELVKWMAGKTNEELLEITMRGPPIDFKRLFTNLPEGFPFHKRDDAPGDDSGNPVPRQTLSQPRWESALPRSSPSAPSPTSSAGR